MNTYYPCMWGNNVIRVGVVGLGYWGPEPGAQLRGHPGLRAGVVL